MNRDIKFRAWNKKKKQLIDQSTMNIKICDINNANYNELLIFQQYTGLKDESGTEIYEGDILHGGIEYYMQFGNVLVGIGECFGNEEIKDEDNMVYGVYIEVDNEKIGISQVHASTYTVIGNIYENNNLLGRVANE